MKLEFEQIRTALEEHLSSINENSSEIQALFDFLHQLEVKVDKLSMRIDQMQMSSPEKISVSPLDHTEKKIFLILYTEETPLSFDEIAVRANLPKSIVPDCVSNLILKGIPLQRSSYNNKLFLQLEPTFKELQAKENIINLSLNSFL